MKILLVYPDNIVDDNPYIRTLKKSLNENGVEVDWGYRKFWDESKQYDIIHIQWPEAFFGGRFPTDIESLLLKKRFKEIKQCSKIVYTRHNIEPHFKDYLSPEENENSEIRELYAIIQKEADAIIHLGEFSLNEFLINQPNCKSKNVVIPHQIYPDEYILDIKSNEAKNKLKIPLNKFVILTFGAYRNDEERALILAAFKRLNIKNKFLLAPNIFKKKKISLRNPLKWLKNSLTPFQLKLNQIQVSEENFISDELLPYYFCAADIVVIQRKSILNSGNLPLGFLFKKVVVGPNVGNINELLIATGNPTFNPDLLPDSLISAIVEAKKLVASKTGELNYEYACKNWNQQIITTKHIDLYQSLLIPNA